MSNSLVSVRSVKGVTRPVSRLINKTKMTMVVGAPYFRVMEDTGFSGRYFVNNGTTNGRKTLDRLVERMKFLPLNVKLRVCGDAERTPVSVVLKGFKPTADGEILIDIKPDSKEN